MLRRKAARWHLHARRALNRDELLNVLVLDQLGGASNSVARRTLVGSLHGALISPAGVRWNSGQPLSTPGDARQDQGAIVHGDVVDVRTSNSWTLALAIGEPSTVTRPLTIILAAAQRLAMQARGSPPRGTMRHVQPAPTSALPYRATPAASRATDRQGSGCRTAHPCAR